MQVLVVLPTFQEAATIEEIVRAVRSSAIPPDGDRPHVLVVDDSSPDDTAGIVERTFAEDGGVTVLRRPSKAGLGSAYRDGFRWGLDRGYEVLVEMDADGSHDVDVLPRLIASVDGGADLAIGARYIEGGSIPEWSPWRRWLSRWGNRYATAALGLTTTDATSGYRAYRSAALAEIVYGTMAADGYAFQIEGTYRITRLSGKIEEIPIHFTDRHEGTSKMSAGIIAEALKMVTLWAVRDRTQRLRARWLRPSTSPRGTPSRH